MSEFRSQKAFVDNMLGMYGTRGWRDFLKPELVRIRQERLDRMVYGSNDPHGILAIREAIVLMDELLAIEDNVRQMAEVVANDVQEAGNVLQSATQDADEVGAQQ